MAGVFEIKEGLVDDYERHQFEPRESDHQDGVWGVWDWDAGDWSHAPNYTRQDAARIAGAAARRLRR